MKNLDELPTGKVVTCALAIGGLFFGIITPAVADLGDADITAPTGGIDK